MPKALVLVDEGGKITVTGVCKLSYLLILASLVYLAALAVNDFAQQVLEKYVRKDGLFGYFIYAVLTVFLVIFAVYLGCWWSPDLVEYINVSPIS
uniref:Uncharacterized protein n=1 Tax=viral metagenome TaxID=1070528 RepID=A0A6C0IYU1_9ZZZZ